jgi:energy-coupling factor transport system ATP-binding protein
MGRNGSGKTSLLWALTGIGIRTAGQWSVNGERLDGATRTRARGAVRLVPSTASDLLYLDTVQAECAQADQGAAAPPGTARTILDELTPGISGDSHPRDLSEGQRLSLVLAVQLTAGAPVLLLDEPTRGLDYGAKTALASTLKRLAAEGRAVGVATHDVEFAATVADHAVVMAAGEVIAEGRADEVLAGSAVFAPQIAKVLAPAPYLTLSQVAAALSQPSEQRPAPEPSRVDPHSIEEPAAGRSGGAL